MSDPVGTWEFKWDHQLTVKLDSVQATKLLHAYVNLRQSANATYAGREQLDVLDQFFKIIDYKDAFKLGT